MLKAYDGGRLFGATFGSERPWVLALHGWGRTHVDFGRVLEGLDALALDLPGFGASPPPPVAWGTEEYADAVSLVLDELAPAAVLVGHSFGGRVAVKLAADHPDRVAALVVSGTPLLHPDGRQPSSAFDYRVARALHRWRLLTDQRMERMRQRRGSADYRAARGVMREVLVRAVNESYERELAMLRCPVELVWGEDDTAVPLAVAEAAASIIPDARITPCPGAGHLTPITASHLLRDAIERHRHTATRR